MQPVPADRWQPGSLAGMQAIPTDMTVQQKLKEAEAELAEVQVRAAAAAYSCNPYGESLLQL